MPARTGQAYLCRNNSVQCSTIFRLAWDIVGTAFGSRQLLYERYFSGDPVRLTASRYLTYAKAPVLERVRDFLRQAD